MRSLDLRLDERRLVSLQRRQTPPRIELNIQNVAVLAHGELQRLVERGE